MPGQKSHRHHYIPRFYLERWAIADRQLYEISWRHEGLVPRKTYPNGTGYKDNLNTLPGLPEGLQTVLEDAFFMVADDVAAKALCAFEKDGGQDLSVPVRSGWSRLLRGLETRHPDNVAALREQHTQALAARYKEVRARYPDFRKEGDPPTWDEAKRALDNTQADERSFALLRQMTVDDAKVGKFINNMIWSVITLPALFPRCFLTSDRPVVRSNGIAYENSSIALPLNPRQLFVAVNNQPAVEQLKMIAPSALVHQSNMAVVKQAGRFVFAHSTVDLHFISQYLRRSSAAPTSSRWSRS